MNMIEVVNFQHVESLKLTGEATIYLQFVSGRAKTFEFSDSARAESMMLSFESWCYTQHQYGGYAVSIGKDGKAGPR